jgi:SAM-dependent methyltransferase
MGLSVAFPKAPDEYSKRAGGRRYMTDSIACPVCGSPQTEDWGPAVHRQPTIVAGIPVDLSDLPMRHRRCPVCEYRFVYPRIPTERLLACYAKSVDKWGTGEEVTEGRAYSTKKALLEKYALAKSALDFGCYDGGFLAYLGPEWHKAGIEPSRSAAEKARARGVEIIGSTLSETDVAEHAERFGAIIIFDVMEHIPDPVGDLARLREMLMPGGLVLIETGDTDTPDYRRFGTRHPYCGIPEHIGFFNRKSIEIAGKRAGLTLAHYENSRHYNYSNYRLYPWWVRAYETIRFMRSIKIPMSRRMRQIADGPVPRAVYPFDHFLAVLRRDPCPQPMAAGAAQQTQC